MIRKLLCKFKAHEPEFEVVRCNGDGPEGILRYEEQTDQFSAYIFINMKCKHCGKPLGSRMIKVTYPAKEIGFHKHNEVRKIIKDLAYGHQSRKAYNELIKRAGAFLKGK